MSKQDDFYTCPFCGHEDDSTKFVDTCPMCESFLEGAEAQEELNQIDSWR